MEDVFGINEPHDGLNWDDANGNGDELETETRKQSEVDFKGEDGLVKGKDLIACCSKTAHNWAASFEGAKTVGSFGQTHFRLLAATISGRAVAMVCQPLIARGTAPDQYQCNIMATRLLAMRPATVTVLDDHHTVAPHSELEGPLSITLNDTGECTPAPAATIGTGLAAALVERALAAGVPFEAVLATSGPAEFFSHPKLMDEEARGRLKAVTQATERGIYV
ncbi:hypothetical protein J8273_0126 [Carpediemonas membranifera]|uniref:Uncharacterized protein n=1 Tax=Carpediemonas membranifera TaxID=201153 RepID=A0A8J6AV28_9EUKA|nr:hypothetical protein J8273_0126 [Carpediemonas membranifera]|eukprot:KAG9394918.1 hypothetical protein J8273_0126 [Carpediemonas membranifera]